MKNSKDGNGCPLASSYKSKLAWNSTKLKTYNEKQLGELLTLPIAEILSGKNARAWVSMAFTYRVNH